MPADGWGGNLAAAVSTALDSVEGISSVGGSQHDLRKLGDFYVEGTGASEDSPEAFLTGNGAGYIRERCRVVMCIQVKDQRIDFIPIMRSVRRLGPVGDWDDLQIDFPQDPAYVGGESSGGEIVGAAFELSGRIWITL